jgi:hypothetical protein
MFKRIVIFVVFFVGILGGSCWAEEISKDKLINMFSSCAGRIAWINKNHSMKMSLIYIQKSLMMTGVSDISHKFKDESEFYKNTAKSFDQLEEVNIGIIDFDNRIIVAKRHNGEEINIQAPYNEDLARLFLNGVILIDNPFDHNETPQEISDIKNRIMHVGFNDEQAELCWGYPDKVNKTTTQYGTSEQWVYYYGDGTEYLYLENNIVTGWQN